MIRKIIQIEERKCNGCGQCAVACHEGAIAMVHGKAKLMREDYCDGLGDCLPTCPTGAITFVEREADAYDPAAVKAGRREETPSQGETLSCGCPGSRSGFIPPRRNSEFLPSQADMPSQLRQWPVQMKLAPVNAPYFSGAHLLIAADCTAYAYGNFHQDFIRDKIVLIGCPKLDEGGAREKLTEILRQNRVQSLTVVRMEVPCCGGIEHMARAALVQSGKEIPWKAVVISTDGERQ